MASLLADAEITMVDDGAAKAIESLGNAPAKPYTKADVAALAQRLKILTDIAKMKRVMFCLRITFDLEKPGTYYVRPYLTKARTRGQFTIGDPGLIEQLDKLITKDAKPLPTGWTLDVNSLAEALLSLINDPREQIEKIYFKANFSAVRTKLLFGCWIDGRLTKTKWGWHPAKGIGAAKSTDATAAVMESHTQAIKEIEENTKDLTVGADPPSPQSPACGSAADCPGCEKCACPF